MDRREIMIKIKLFKNPKKHTNHENIEYWSAVEFGHHSPDLTNAHVVNSVKILRNSILLVTFHHIVFVYDHYSSCSHQSGLGTAKLFFISTPTFLFNASQSAITVTTACCIIGDSPSDSFTRFHWLSLVTCFHCQSKAFTAMHLITVEFP